MYSSLKNSDGETENEQDQKLASYVDFIVEKIPAKKIAHPHVVNELNDTKR